MVITFRQNEDKNIESIKRHKENETDRLDLVRFYIEMGKYSLARRHAKNLQKAKTVSASGELFFSLGCIDSQFNEHQKASENFNKAIDFDIRFKKRIDNYRQTMGDEFMTFVHYFKNRPVNRDASVKHMLLKGLRFCPNHQKLNQELLVMVKNDIEKIVSFMETGNYKEAKKLLTEWFLNFEKQTELPSLLPQNLLGQIFSNQGRLFLKEKKYSDALEYFKKGLEYLPSEHELHFLIIDTHFVAQDYSGAIDALNTAVKVDNKFAAYWETIGDSLEAGGQIEDAIIAYERCFMYLPENINILKKIGDCYMAIGKLEAAKSAYEQLKLKIQRTEIFQPNNET